MFVKMLTQKITPLEKEMPSGEINGRDTIGGKRKKMSVLDFLEALCYYGPIKFFFFSIYKLKKYQVYKMMNFHAFQNVNGMLRGSRMS
jgi:hypothetical protein